MNEVCLSFVEDFVLCSSRMIVGDFGEIVNVFLVLVVFKGVIILEIWGKILDIFEIFILNFGSMLKLDK